jgi:hypothetical protein
MMVMRETLGILAIGSVLGLSAALDGQLRTYTTADGLSDLNVRQLFKDSAGTFWAVTNTAVHQLVGDRFAQVIRRSDPRFSASIAGNLYI